MKYAGPTRKLLALGCEFRRCGAGSYMTRRNPATGRQVPIPYHRSKDIGRAL